MQQHIKYLVIEDDPEWARAISAEVRAYFEDVCRLHKARVRDDSAYDGDQGWQRLRGATYDLATLDMNLGAGSSKSRISGLDLLGAIADGNRVFFVIIITGAVNDASLEQIYGADAAALMRYGAMNEAVKKLPAERVRILHKPTGRDVAATMVQLAPHLRSALDQYRVVSRERNIFRPVPGNRMQWEIRYDGGPRRTLPSSETFEIIRSALAQPNREMKVIQLVQSIVHDSPSARGPVTGPGAAVGDGRPHRSGIDWETIESEGLQTPDHAPVDTIEGTYTIEVLIRGLLRARTEGHSVDQFIELYREKFGPGPLFLLPAKIREYGLRRQRADEEFGDDSGDLNDLLAELTPALRNLRKQTVPSSPRAKGTVRVSIGVDTKEMILARKHWQRARDYLLRDAELKPFVAHIEACVERGLTAKGHIHYAPDDAAEFPPFWLTD